MGAFRDTHTPRPASGRTLLGVVVLVAVVYAALGAVSLGVGQLSGLAAPIWPSAGVAFVFTLVWGWRVLPGVTVGSALVNAYSLAQVGESPSVTAVVAVVIGVGAALQAGAGAVLVRRLFGTRLTLIAPREILLVLLLAGPVACVVNPTVGVATQLAAGILGPDQAVIGWLTWWTGDSIGVFVFAPLTLMLLPGSAELWAGRRWKVALPSLVIVVGLTLVFVQFSALEREAIRADVEQLTSEAAADLEADVARNQEVLEAIRSFVLASDQVTAAEFATFTDGMLARHPNLQALSWNPIVTATELGAFQEAQRRQSGFADYTVTERAGSGGGLVPVSARPDYVPVAYIEPLSANAAALGFDIQSDPTRAEAVAAARDSGAAVGTAPIDLVQESGTQKGMLALLPLYAGGDVPVTADARREALRGYAVGVYRLGDLLEETYAGAKWDDIDIRLLDVTEPGDPVVVADLPARAAPTVDDISAADSGLSVPISVYGRSWELQVTPTSGRLAQPTPPATPALLLSALMLVFLLEAFVLLLTGLERAARREAEESSYDANHDLLTGLASRRSFMRALAELRSRPAHTATHDVLLFCDLDRFKQVNDTGGHEAGDRMLVAVADALRQGIRGNDVAARMGGDEFAVILMSCPLERGVQIAGDLVRAVDECAVVVGDTEMRVGISIGAVEVDPADGLSVDELLRRADAACYEAKSAGRGQVRTFSA